MGLSMAVSMPAMMALTAAPFFAAYWRDARQPAAIATVAVIYLAVWTAIGLILDSLTNAVMIPSPSVVGAAIAVAVALVYAVMPWGRWARERCRHMSMREPRDPRIHAALIAGTSYAACCVICSAGLMLVVIVLGMSNPLVIIAGAAVMLAYKLTPASRAHG